MLDQDTKRKIDNARDILVGKVTDPKSQVEQITIALIYKFMDDMDKQSEEWGGEATFFSGEYAKYSWSKIFDPRLGGFDLINTYGEAIMRMNQNPNIPQLFRDIFKNAYLPYRDPETLKAFLKEINEFKYDHSEQLGNAYEYLLSVMSSQGDAGQFRTPRHIIDFIVAVVEPKKSETVLDPACGTAGFLISSFKHILHTNTAKTNGDGLSTDEKTRLMTNLIGYDISPDMVRLSLVNMYLHGFPNPKINEYDTLTSEDRWFDKSDVILANPPFMTPKGGIRPHKRFSIQANRSEVLFVDYIAEHLNPGGRAGVIVPEGIIFQSSNAYKALRKMLVEEYLWAVVSLPAGIFQPYSGVKTSILLMDKHLSKKTDKILFIKIEHDGFDLGAQRRPNGKDDLPGALEYLKQYKRSIYNESEIEDAGFAHSVKKEKIAESGDWNLSGERYKQDQKFEKTKCEIVSLGDIAEIIAGQSPESKYYNETGKGTPFYQGKTEFGLMYLREPVKWTVNITKKAYKGNILMSVRAPVGPVNICDFNEICIGRGLAAIRPTKNVMNMYLYYYLKSIENGIKGSGGSVFDSISRDSIKKIQIPLPPLEVQKAIVEEIEGFQKIIDGAKQVVDSWKPTIKIDPAWEMVELGEVIGINENTIDPEKIYRENEFVYIDITSVENGTGRVDFNNKIIGNEAPSRARRKVKVGDVLLSTVRPNLKAFAFLRTIPENTVVSTGFAVLSFKEKLLPLFVYYQLFGENLQNQMITKMGKGSYPSINQKDVHDLKIPLPPLPIQQEIVAQIETEREIVESNKRLIAIYEGKIKDKIAEVWGE